MGKDLNGNELGKDLSQIKSGYYMARFCFNKKTYKKVSKNLEEAKKWLIEKNHKYKRNNNTIKKKNQIIIVRKMTQ